MLRQPATPAPTDTDLPAPEAPCRACGVTGPAALIA